MIGKKVFVGIIAGIVFFLHASLASAQTHQVTYDFNFYMRNTADIETQLDLTLRNLRADLYINEFSLVFPKGFSADNLQVKDELDNPIQFNIDSNQNNTKITFNFNEPEQGKNSENKLKILYTNKNLYNDKGGVAEVILPLLTPKDNTSINATLHLPENFERKITVSKPVPSSIEFNKVHWVDVKARTIVALFGDAQTYRTKLSYALTNNALTRAKQYIALPPETLYQKVYVQSIQPLPEEVFVDDDGNYLAGYTVSPDETLNIKYDGFVKVFVQPQSDIMSSINELFEKQKAYLLTEQPFWKLGIFVGQKDIQSLKNVGDIYSYVVDHLTYNPQRLSEKPIRYGAENALKNPENALCTEFTDLFVALAREKGIYAREIEGYGYSDKQVIRPQSLSGDILHAWPEYYDIQRQLWIPVDPTWENTSGIDYISAFDVNHITLAIHGKYSDSPLPAGFYKTSNSKDIKISVSNLIPLDEPKIMISDTIQTSIVAGVKNTAVIKITNTGKTFIHDLIIVPTAKALSFDQKNIDIGLIAPYQTKTIQVTYTAENASIKTDVVEFTYNGEVISKKTIQIQSQKSNILQKIIGASIGVLILIGTYIFITTRRKR